MRGGHFHNKNPSCDVSKQHIASTVPESPKSWNEEGNAVYKAHMLSSTKGQKN